MKFTLTGSLGNTSKPLAGILIGAGHQVNLISSNPANKAAIESIGATAFIGSIADAGFLSSAFAGADAVYTMVPPNFGPNYTKYVVDTAHNYAEAVTAAGVARVVNLSSIGAHLKEGTGPIAGLNQVEGILNNLENVAIKHLRAAFFYVNFYRNIDMIKSMDILGANYGVNTPLVMVDPQDIAAAAAAAMQTPFTGKSVSYIVSDERSAGETAAVLGAAIGKPTLQWLEFTDAQSLDGMTRAGLPEAFAKKYVEMGVATRTGKLWEDYNANKPSISGRIRLEEFATAFAEKFKAN